MKKNLLYVLFVLLVVGVSACLDDNNNFEYKKVNGLQGTYLGNLKDKYNVAVHEDLRLEPTFKFTIDSIQPDVSFEWLIDGELVDANTPSYTFNFSKTGIYEVTVSVIDNTIGRKFSKSVQVYVRSPYLRGWVVLSEIDGKSSLSFVKTEIVQYTVINSKGKEVMRDSIVYRGVEKNMLPNLGTGPKGLLENIGYPTNAAWLDVELTDEIVVMQDRWAELNGNTLQLEMYTDQEFGDELPENFSPVEAAMSFSAKLVRDKNGFIYLHKKPVASDFHAGMYTSVPLWNSTRFKGLYQNQKCANYNMKLFPACNEENTLVAIWDGGTYYNDKITENTSRFTGNVYSLVEQGDKHFEKMKEDIVTMLPATSGPDNYNDYSNPDNAGWVALMNAPATQNYALRYFYVSTGLNFPLVEVEYYFEKNIGSLSDYRDMAVFQNNKYVVIADGASLYYCQYGTDDTKESTMIKLGDLPGKVVSLSYHDLGVDGYDYLPYNGQLGVALEDGSFYIYEVIEKEKNGKGVTQAAAIKQLFPNEETAKEGDNKFGKIVDTLYKMGSYNNLFKFEF